jgi:U4/U6.U5 tri-snRNP component SNU23
MADKPKSSDTDFRRVFDRDAAAKRAKEGDRQRREDGEARAAAEAQGKKWHKRAATPPDVRETEARKSRFSFEGMIGRSTLVPAGSGIGKRGRGAGLYCEACDRTYNTLFSVFLPHPVRE